MAYVTAASFDEELERAREQAEWLQRLLDSVSISDVCALGLPRHVRTARADTH